MADVPRYATLIIALLLCAPVMAQRAATKSVKSKSAKRKAAPVASKSEAEAKESDTKASDSKSDSKDEAKPETDAAKSRASLIAATNAYRESLDRLQVLYQAEQQRAATMVAKKRALLAQGLIARRELETSQTALSAIKAKLDENEKKIGETEQLLAEASVTETPAKTAAQKAGTLYTGLRMIRYTGTNNWALSDVSKVEGFFLATFRKPLPISAFGQTATHDKLGFDHRGSVDVAVHPDTAEGLVLLAYLRNQGIPYIAFRSAVPGSATGAHIHIGRPSHRI